MAIGCKSWGSINCGSFRCDLFPWSFNIALLPLVIHINTTNMFNRKHSIHCKKKKERFNSKSWENARSSNRLNSLALWLWKYTYIDECLR